MGFLNTAKCGPSIAFNFRNTWCDMLHVQREITDEGPMLFFDALNSLGNTTSNF
jgi:hypothetical protein